MPEDPHLGRHSAEAGSAQCQPRSRACAWQWPLPRGAGPRRPEPAGRAGGGQACVKDLTRRPYANSVWGERVSPGPGENSCTALNWVEVHPSARGHGVSDEDIEHAVAHPLVADFLGEEPDRWLLIGPDRAANLLELAVLVTSEGDELVIHAMPLRPKYERLLNDD
jgi:hypothetical protein